jgi:hypothetical protein
VVRKTTFFTPVYMLHPEHLSRHAQDKHIGKDEKQAFILRRMAVCSGYIADGVLRGLFGFMPSLEATSGSLALKQPNVDRGFEGTLKHVRYRGELWTIVASAQGVRAEKE